MNEDFFFEPRVGRNYEQGFRGIRSLVLGVAHICTLPCEKYKSVCCPLEGGTPHRAEKPDRAEKTLTLRDLDRECPVYRGREAYYRLSNSNRIEIDSFIEGEARYPAYSAFTYYMTRMRDCLPSEAKAAFWESVAFTNFLPFFLGNDELEGLERISEETVEQAFAAFARVCRELTPQVIYAWNPTVADWLKAHPDTFLYVGMADMEFQLSVYLFVPLVGGASGNQLRRLKFRHGIKPERHYKNWYIDLVNRHLQSSVIPEKNAGPKRSNEYLRHLGIFLSECAEDILGTSGDHLYFRDSQYGSWTTAQIGYFVKELKRIGHLGSGANPGLKQIFREDQDFDKYSSAYGKGKKDSRFWEVIRNRIEKKEEQIRESLEKYATDAGKTLDRFWNLRR